MLGVVKDYSTEEIYTGKDQIKTSIVANKRLTDPGGMFHRSQVDSVLDFGIGFFFPNWNMIAIPQCT